MDVCGDFTVVHVTGLTAGRDYACINRLIAASASWFSEQEEREIWIRNWETFLFDLALPPMSCVTVDMIVTVLCLSFFICQ